MRRLLCLMLVLIILFAQVCAAAAQDADQVPVLSINSTVFPLPSTLTLTAWVVNASASISATDSYVLTWIREKANINLVIDREFTGNEAKNQLMLAIEASDHLPDLLLCTRWTKAECALYSSYGVVICLDEYLQDCVNWNRLNEICGPAHTADLRMPDGHIYCYGSVNECFHLTHQARMWVYRPWIDLLCDGKLPETTEEFYTYLYRVATLDPNGNGMADEIPLNGQICEGWANDPFTFLSNAFVHNNTIWGSTNQTVAAGCYIDGGKVICNWVEDGYREALRYMNRLYHDGLLNPQVFTQNYSQMMAKTRATPHLVGAVAMGGIPDVDETSTRILPDGTWSEWVCLPPLEGPDGVRLSYQSTYDYFYNCNGLITRDCEHPWEAAQLFDLLASAEGTMVQNYGPEGIGWEWCDASVGSGINGSRALYRINKLKMQNNAWPPDVQICSLYDTFRRGLLVEEGVLNGEDILWQCAATYEPYSPGMETVYPSISCPLEQSLALLLYQSSIETYVRRASINFIIGHMDLDRDWNTYLSQLDTLGQDEYRRMLQEDYDNYLSTARQ